MARLTDQQKAFVAEYVRSGFDRLQAIKKAGYSEKSWETTACKLLKKQQVKCEIERLLTQVQEKSTIEVAEIIQELRKVAFAPVSERINNSDRLRALELLGKFLAMWSERVIHEDPEKVAQRRAYETEEEKEIARIVGIIRVHEVATGRRVTSVKGIEFQHEKPTDPIEPDTGTQPPGWQRPTDAEPEPEIDEERQVESEVVASERSQEG